MYLDTLEAEAIYILRETVAQFKRPVLLFSGGKDSLVLLRLAEKAFRPEKFQFPILHVDTGHNFPETLEFRDRTLFRLGETLTIRRVEDSIRTKCLKDETGVGASRNALQSITLTDAIQEFEFDAAIGGARRDEEKSRAKEKVFSFRSREGQWIPERQRPELWQLYNGMIAPGENMRIFPLSNWRELDVWNYIEREKLEVPTLYFSHLRNCFYRNGVLLPESPHNARTEKEKVQSFEVRFRTLGDVTCSSAMLSQARTVSEVIAELNRTRFSERASRLDDQRSDSAMEERKRNGYF